MIHEATLLRLATLTVLLCLGACSPSGNDTPVQKAPPAPNMPAGWNIVSDLELPADQVKTISQNVNADLSSVRNTVYDVGGMRVQLNTMIVPDEENAERLLASLRTMKSEVGFLRKGLTVYEFVGTNDVIPAIEAGRAHLESM